jgi:hypothetical protein
MPQCPKALYPLFFLDLYANNEKSYLRVFRKYGTKMALFLFTIQGNILRIKEIKAMRQN